MSNSSKAEPRAGRWYVEYLAMGSQRSLEKLAADARRIAAERGWSFAPSKRTLENWSSNDGWSRKALEHDREVRAQVHKQLVYKRADQSQRSQDRALEIAEKMQGLVEDALTVRTERIDPETGEQAFTVDGKGEVIKLFDERPKRFDELSKPAISSIIALTREAAATNRALLGEAPEKLQAYLDKTADEDPESRYPGRDKIAHMGIMVGTMVERLNEDIQERRALTARIEAARQDGLSDAGLELIENNRDLLEPPGGWNADDPNLQWEVVPEDEY